MLLSLNPGDTVKPSKPLIERRSVIIATVMFLGLLGLAWWFYQLVLMWFWQQDIQHKLEPVKLQQLVSKADQPSPLLISNIALPALPKFNDIQDASASINTESATGEQARTPIIEPEAKLDTKPRAKLDHEKVNQLTKLSPPEVRYVQTQNRPATKMKKTPDAQTVFQQLRSPSGLDLQIALPQNAIKRERLLDYLYRCSGAQFAVLQQQQLVHLSPKRYVATSKWLRVVSGDLSTQERRWLANHQGTPIRLFPHTMDQRLANYIATALQGSELHSLRAQYTFTDAGLTLSHVKLNQQSITTNWLLHQSQCR